MGYASNPLVNWLFLRSYGQGGTVAVPNSAPSASTGPSRRGKFPAGVGDVLERLVDQYSSWSSPAAHSSSVEWCFLVGGPGNGKSEALKQLAEVLMIGLPPKVKGAPAQRVVPAGWPDQAETVVPGLEIAFINDASIPHALSLTNGQLGSLFIDVREGIDRLLEKRTPIVLFGNVNRGILVEEQDALRGITHTTVAAEVAEQIILWLANPPLESNVAQEHTEIQTLVPLDPVKPYYAQFLVPLVKKGADHNIVVHVVFLDVLSLLEPTPGIQGKALDFSGELPVVEPYDTIGGFSSDAVSREGTIAGQLLSSLLGDNDWEQGGCIDRQSGTLCDAFNRCPFAQNAKWLRYQQLRRRFLDTLRAAEVASSRRFTYRDLLGHISLSILGQPEPEWLKGSELCHWVAGRIRDLDNVYARADNIVDLVSHRIYMNLFPTPDKTAWKRARSRSQRKDTIYSAAAKRMTLAAEAPRIQALEQAFNHIDPARDVDSWGGIRSVVMEIAESLEIESPSTQLLQDNLIPADAFSEIERIVDQVLRDEIITELSSGSMRGDSSAPLTRTRFLRKWRSTLLLRQVGLALGHVAFESVLAAWLAEQNNALRGGSTPLDLGHGIQALILPPSSKFFLAPLRPRTYSMADKLPKNTVLVEVPLADLRVEIISHGDTLIAEVIRTRRPIGKVTSLVVDLAVAREALLHTSGNTYSFTEIGNSAFARIERARASLVGRERMKNATVYFTDEVGNRYRVVSNPAGPAPLRVTLS
jgi:hypothetical protein